MNVERYYHLIIIITLVHKRYINVIRNLSHAVDHKRRRHRHYYVSGLRIAQIDTVIISFYNISIYKNIIIFNKIA